MDNATNPAVEPRDHRSVRYRMHLPGGNYRSNGLPITDGLRESMTGVFDNRSLRFIEDVDRAATLPDPVLPAHDVSIQNVKCIGSYNWTDDEIPTILVPGSPPIWKNDQIPFTLRPDEEVFAGRPVFVDRGIGSDQSISLLALFTSVDILSQSGSFDWPSVDLVTDRNCLRNLIRWIEQGKTLDDFRIDMHLAGPGTLIFTRWKAATEVMPMPGSFGFSYEQSQTHPASGCETSSEAGHDRILCYDFDGMRLVVRFEVDACLPQSTSSADTNVDEVVDPMDSINIGGEVSTLRVRRVGTLVPQESIVELVTRSVRTAKLYLWKQVVPQLFFSQTPHHILAIHNRGTFNRVKWDQIDQSQSLRTAIDNMQPTFKKLRVLLAVIQQVVIAYGQGAQLSLVQRNGRLEVFERITGALPPEVAARFR